MANQMMQQINQAQQQQANSYRGNSIGNASQNSTRGNKRVSKPSVKSSKGYQDEAMRVRIGQAMPSKALHNTIRSAPKNQTGVPVSHFYQTQTIKTSKANTAAGSETNSVEAKQRKGATNLSSLGARQVVKGGKGTSANNSSLGGKNKSAIKDQVRVQNVSCIVGDQRMTWNPMYATKKNNFLGQTANSPLNSNNIQLIKGVEEQTHQRQQSANIQKQKKRKLTLTQRTLNQGAFHQVGPQTTRNGPTISHKHSSSHSYSFNTSRGNQNSSVHAKKKIQLVHEEQDAMRGYHTSVNKVNKVAIKSPKHKPDQNGFGIPTFYPHSSTNQTAPQQIKFGQPQQEIVDQIQPQSAKNKTTQQQVRTSQRPPVTQFLQALQKQKQQISNVPGRKKQQYSFSKQMLHNSQKQEEHSTIQSNQNTLSSQVNIDNAVHFAQNQEQQPAQAQQPYVVPNLVFEKMQSPMPVSPLNQTLEPPGNPNFNSQGSSVVKGSLSIEAKATTHFKGKASSRPPYPVQKQSLDHGIKKSLIEQPKQVVAAKSHRSKTTESLAQQKRSVNASQTIVPKKGDQSQRSTSYQQKASARHSHSSQLNLEKPLTPGKCLKHFGSQLTDYEKTEILDFPQIYYYGEGAKKVQARLVVSSSDEDDNFGYDDSKGNYKINAKDHIAYRYELVSFLGKGSFGIAVKCYDHKNKEHVALKIIKNKKKYYYQAGVELKILQYLKENDPEDTMNIIHMRDYVVFRKHLCISFELMSINLYEFLKLNDFEGLSLSLIRRFAIQMLYSLKYLKDNNIIHCDLKPENVLLKDPTKSGIKIIDFGSSCFQNERVYTYIQSRFYRAPEIILGIPYTPCIDMWSFGCIMAEFAMGYPIFPGEDEMDQLSLIMEINGLPSNKLLSQSQRKTKFFSEGNTPIMVPNSQNKIRKPGTKVLEDVLECSDSSFVNFIEQCLEWDPDKRLTPEGAIRHQWILEGLPPKVLIHHQKLHNIPTRELPPHIRKQRAQYLALQSEEMQQEFAETEQTPEPLQFQPNPLNHAQSQRHSRGSSTFMSQSTKLPLSSLHLQQSSHTGQHSVHCVPKSSRHNQNIGSQSLEKQLRHKKISLKQSIPNSSQRQSHGQQLWVEQPSNEQKFIAS